LGYLKARFYQGAGPHTGAFLTSIRSDLYFRIIELLVAARKDAAMTQVELGKKLGQRQTFVSKFELGERRLDVAEFLAVCTAIDVEPLSVIQAAESDQSYRPI